MAELQTLTIIVIYCIHFLREISDERINTNIVIFFFFGIILETINMVTFEYSEKGYCFFSLLLCIVKHLEGLRSDLKHTFYLHMMEQYGEF